MGILSVIRIFIYCLIRLFSFNSRKRNSSIDELERGEINAFACDKQNTPSPNSECRPLTPLNSPFRRTVEGDTANLQAPSPTACPSFDSASSIKSSKEDIACRKLSTERFFYSPNGIDEMKKQQQFKKIPTVSITEVEPAFIPSNMEQALFSEEPFVIQDDLSHQINLDDNKKFSRIQKNKLDPLITVNLVPIVNGENCFNFYETQMETNFLSPEFIKKPSMVDHKRDSEINAVTAVSADGSFSPLTETLSSTISTLSNDSLDGLSSQKNEFTGFNSNSEWIPNDTVDYICDSDASSVVSNLSDFEDCFDQFGVYDKEYEKKIEKTRRNFPKFQSSATYPPFSAHHQARRNNPQGFRNVKKRFQLFKDDCTALTDSDFLDALPFFNARVIIALYVEWRLRVYETMVIKGEESLKNLQRARDGPHNKLWLGVFGNKDTIKKLSNYDRRAISNPYVSNHLNFNVRRVKSDTVYIPTILQLLRSSTQLMTEQAFVASSNLKSTKGLRETRLIQKYKVKGDFEYVYAALYYAAFTQESTLKAVTIDDILSEDELEDWWYLNLRYTSFITPQLCFEFLDKEADSCRDRLTEVKSEPPKAVIYEEPLNKLSRFSSDKLFTSHELVAIAELISLNEPPLESGKKFYYEEFQKACQKKRDDYRYSPEIEFKAAFREKFLQSNEKVPFPRPGEIYEKRCDYFSKYACQNIFISKPLKRSGSIYEVFSDGIGRVIYGSVLDYEATRNNILLHFGFEIHCAPSEEELIEREEAFKDFHNMLSFKYSANEIYEFCGTHSRAEVHKNEVLKRMAYYLIDENKEISILRRILSLRIVEPTTSFTRYEYDLWRTFYPDVLYLNYSKSGRIPTGSPYIMNGQWRKDLCVSTPPMVDINSALFPHWFKLSASNLFAGAEHAGLNRQKPDKIDLDLYEPLPENSYLVAAELRVLRALRHKNPENIPLLEKWEVRALHQLMAKIRKYYTVPTDYLSLRMDGLQAMLRKREYMSCYTFNYFDYACLMDHAYRLYEGFNNQVVNLPPRIM